MLAYFQDWRSCFQLHVQLDYGLDYGGKTVSRLPIVVCLKYMWHLYNWMHGEGKVWGQQGGDLDVLGELGIKPQAMCMQGSHSTPELKLQPLVWVLQADCFIFMWTS